MTNRKIVALLAVSSLLMFGTACSRGPKEEAPPAKTEVVTTTTATAPAPVPPRPAAPAVTTTTTTKVAPAPAPVRQPPAPVPSAKPTPVPKAKPARSVAKAPRPTVSTQTSEFVWQNWGAAPYAANEEDAKRPEKLLPALDLMVEAGLMPREVADAFAKGVRDHPKGLMSPVDAKIYITPGMRLNGMMVGGKKPHLKRNVVVGRNIAGKGQVKVIETYGWRIVYNGVTYTLLDPFVCGNWSLVVEGNAPPPPPPPPPPGELICYVERLAVMGRNEDSENHFAFYGSMPTGVCAKFRILRADGSVLQDWKDYEKCLDLTTCNYGLVTKELGGMALQFRGNILVPPECWNGCIIEKRLPAEFAESNSNLILECLIRIGNRGSCGVMVRYNDYHSRVARIFYSREQVPADWGAWRKLYWAFVADPIRNCKLAYRP